jgi:hypothetical protein
MNIGYFLSFTGFLALNDPDFCNRFLRSPEAASSDGILSLSSYLRLWALIYAAVTVALGLFKRERPYSGAASSALCVSLPVSPCPTLPVNLKCWLCLDAAADGTLSLSSYLRLWALIYAQLQLLWGFSSGSGAIAAQCPRQLVPPPFLLFAPPRCELKWRLCVADPTHSHGTRLHYL